MSEPHELLGLDPADLATTAAMEDADAFANLITGLVDARENLDLTTTQIADRMGISPAEVVDLERVGGAPPFSMMQRYARAVGLRLDWDLTGASCSGGSVETELNNSA